MTMSDWLVFITVVSPLVCSAKTFPKKVMDLWGPLRRALLYFPRYSDGQYTATAWSAARNDLLAYTGLAENTVCMHRLLTVQLHSAVVHLVDMLHRLLTVQLDSAVVHLVDMVHTDLQPYGVLGGENDAGSQTCY